MRQGYSAPDVKHSVPNTRRGKERSKALLLMGPPPSLRNRLQQKGLLYSFYLTGIRIVLNLNNLQRVQSTAFNSADSIQPALRPTPASMPSRWAASSTKPLPPPSTFPVSYVPCACQFIPISGRGQMRKFCPSVFHFEIQTDEVREQEAAKGPQDGGPVCLNRAALLAVAEGPRALPPGSSNREPGSPSRGTGHPWHHQGGTTAPASLKW